MPKYQNHPVHSEVLRITADCIKNKMYTKVADFQISAVVTKEPVPYENRNEGKKKAFKVGDVWGDVFDCGWFFLKAVVPKEAEGKKLVAKLDFSGEALLFDASGCPVKGFTSVKSKMTYTMGMMGKTVYPLDAKPGETLELTLDAGNNDLFGDYRGGKILEASLSVCNEELRALYYDYAVLYELMMTLSPERAFHHRIKQALTKVERILSDYTEDEAKACRSLLSPLLKAKSAETGFDISVLGHAHLDLAWEWPIRETRRKGGRTFSTAVFHLNHDPDYVFGASQTQLYQWVKTDYPQLFAKIKQLVAQGRWELQGGMWVESDLNVPTGEALVRQLLYGQRFYEENFGQKATVAWLPDTFGFTGALPQLLKSAGMERFVTQKIRTAPHNVDYPHDTFYWEGIDGTKVLTHVAPFENYGSSGSPKEIAACESRFRDKLVSNSCLLLMGQGDGGGGAGYECLESIDRSKNLEGLAPAVYRTAKQFFDRIETEADELETWYGSMDLDMHTGTLTTSSESKRLNKACEVKLHTLEWLLSEGADVISKAELDEIWRQVLLFQFHDILPGSSIKRVYDESLPEYESIVARLDDCIEKACKQIAANFRVQKDETLVFNPSPMWEDAFIPTSGGVSAVKLAPYSVTKAGTGKQSWPVSASGETLENELLTVRFASDGTISSIRAKSDGKEFVRSTANKLCVYRDTLNYNEEWGVENAWDFPIRYADRAAETPTLTETKSYVKGAFAIRENIFSYRDSKIVQRCKLSSGSMRIDFETEVDWFESEKMLRSISDCDVLSHEAVRGLQFGLAKVNLHKNTVWDYAMFERAAQRYVDISSGAYGAALISATKYGYRLQDGKLDINLLRSSNSPGVKIDRGKHKFTYALYLHTGGVRDGGVLEQAYAADYAPLTVSGEQSGPLAEKRAFTQKYGSVVVETVKPAESGDGVVLRVYEPYGVETNETFTFDKPYKSALLTNILEETEKTLALDGELTLRFRPFEIKTVCLK